MGIYVSGDLETVHQGEDDRLTRAVRQQRGLRQGVVAFTTLVALVLPAQARADDSTPVAPEIAAAVAELPIPSLPDLSTTVSLPAAAPSLDVPAVVQAALDAVSHDAPPVAPPAAADPVQPGANATQISPQASVSPVVPTAPISPDPVETTTSASPPSDPVKAEAGTPTSSAADPAPLTDPVPLPAAPQTTSTAAPPSSPTAQVSPASSPTTDVGQYQNGNQTDIAGTHSSPAQSKESPSGVTSSTPEISADSLSDVPQNWTWNWSWNCADDSTGTSTTRPGSLAGGTGWVWNWQWSCGTDPSAGCTGCNTAVTIRILSPGDDGGLVQSISSTSTSIAQTMSSTLQQTVQQIVPPAALQPSPIGLPASSVGIDPVPWPSPELTVPTLPEPSAWPTIGPGPAAATVAAIQTLLLPLDIEPISLGDVRGNGMIELPTFGAARLDDPLDTVFAPGRPFAVAGVAYTEAETRAPVETRTAPVPPARHEEAAAGGASQSPSKPRLPFRLPQRVPFGFGPDLSSGASASGSSSSLGGFALLLGALLILVPSALQLIWVDAATRPRRYTPGRPEHPG